MDPLKRKTTQATIAAFKRIFKKTIRRPYQLRTDKGREFNSGEFRKFMKENDIIYSTSQNPDVKCSIAERCIRTIKGRLFKYLSYKNTYRYVDVLSDLVTSYNNTYHKTIKMTPSQVNDTNIIEVYNNISDSQIIRTGRYKKKPKLKVGDYVRITKGKGQFEKGYISNYTQEVFKVKSISFRDPIVYHLVDLAGEEIEGTFYELEVQKVNFDEGAERAIEMIIKEKGRGKSLQYYVKWLGYPVKFNSWIDAKTVKSII